MMFGNPFFTDFDDSDYYYQPRRGHYPSRARRQAELEEARRQAKIERYYRQKELEEQELLRRRQEYARRIQLQKQLEEEAYEEELRRRRAVAEAEDRRRARQFLRGPSPVAHRYSSEESGASSDESDEEDQPQYRLVRGMDGNIYRVPVPSSRKARSRKTQKPQRGPQQTKGVSTDKEKLSGSAQETLREINSFETEQEVRSQPVAASRRSFSKSQKTTGKTPKGLKTKKRVTIIVEDASDSETEDELHSPWRNRRPSPGEWMEPVEGVNTFP